MSTTVVSMQDATLNLAGSRNYPVAASHTRLTKFDGPESETYQLVLSILRRIAIDVLLSAVRPPSQPPGPVVTGPPGAIPASRRIQFPGYVDLFRDGRMDSRGAMHPISDILGTPPSVLLESGEAEAPSSPLSEATPVAPRQLLYWVHLPLNNTAYVNVSDDKDPSPPPPRGCSYLTPMLFSLACTVSSATWPVSIYPSRPSDTGCHMKEASRTYLTQGTSNLASFSNPTHPALRWSFT